MTSQELRDLIDSLPHFLLIFDRTGCVVDANRPMLDYLERDLEELRNLGPADPICPKIHPEDLQIAAEERRRCREEDLPFDSERRALAQDGSYRWYLFRFKPLHDETGQVWRWICTGTDIHEMKRDDELRRKLLDATPSFIHSARPDGTVEYLNEHWTDYLGFPLQTILRRTPKPVPTSVPNVTTNIPDLVETIHPEDLAEFAREWPAIVASAKPGQFEVRIRRFDGVYRWFLFQAAPLLDNDGKVAKWYVASVDIDERKRAQDELRKRALEAAEQLRLAIDTTPGLAWTAGPDGPADFLNRGWLEYAGLRMEEALGWGFMVSIHPDDIPHGMAAYQSALRSGEMFETEVRVRRHDGEYRWFLFRGNPLRDDAGNIVKWFGTNTDIEDRKRAEDALRESEHSLRMIVDMIPGLVHTASPTGEVQNVSQKELDYFGRTLEELKQWESVVHPDDLERLLRYWEERIRTGDPYDMEVRLLRADGVYRWIHAQGVSLRNDAGQVVRWYFLMTDVDERRKAEEEIRRNERYLAEGQRLSRTGSFSWKVATKETIYLSEECLRIYDFPSDMGVPSWEDRLHIIDPEDRTRWTATIERAIATKSPYDLEYRIVTRMGMKKHVRVVAHPVFHDSGEVSEFVGTVIDITAQHKAEEAMRETERHLRLLIETIPALVWSTKPDGTCIYVNKQYLEYAGCSVDDLLAMNWLGSIHPDDIGKTREAWLRSVRTGERHERMHRIRRADGSYRWFHTIAEPLRDRNHNITQWYGLNIDIDDSRNLAEALRATQARLSRATQIAMVAELSASIAHEINQPLGAVVANGGACEMWLSADPPNLERARIAVGRIIRDGNAAAEVIQRIRALFRQTAPNRIPLSINDVLSEILDLLGNEILRKKVTLETSLAPTLPILHADKVQMQQLLMNLLHNAIESMEGIVNRPRTLTVASRMDRPGLISIDIGDSGSGLENIERIFEPFFTTKDKGMGMGLVICRSIADAHGGTLQTRPNRNHGTIFIVSLPVDIRTP